MKWGWQVDVPWPYPVNHWLCLNRVQWNSCWSKLKHKCAYSLLTSQHQGEGASDATNQRTSSHECNAQSSGPVTIFSQSFTRSRIVVVGGCLDSLLQSFLKVNVPVIGWGAPFWSSGDWAPACSGPNSFSFFHEEHWSEFWLPKIVYIVYIMISTCAMKSSGQYTLMDQNKTIISGTLAGLAFHNLKIGPLSHLQIVWS